MDLSEWGLFVIEERLSKNLTVGDLGGSECVRRGERGVFRHGKTV